MKKDGVKYEVIRYTEILRDANRFPSFAEPVIDKSPPNLINDFGKSSELFFKTLINNLRLRSGLKNIYGGYILFKKEDFAIEWWCNNFLGGISTMAFNENIVKEEFESGKKIILSYIGVPIDNYDFLIENPSIDDLNFQERYLNPELGWNTILDGSIDFKHIGKIRLFKWIGNIN